jgi:hypothetical protein
MADPCDFDVWGVVVDSCRQGALDLLDQHRPNLSQAEQSKLVERAISTEQPVLFASRLGWAAVIRLLTELAASEIDARACPSGYSAGDGEATICPVHELVHNAKSACPVCAGSYVP